MKQLFIIFGVFFCGLIPLQAIETSPTFFYGTMGGGVLSDGHPALSLGLGGRYRKEHHGVDLSMNAQLSALFYIYDGSCSTKARYLFYPEPQKKNAVYFGLGGGYGRQWGIFPSGFGGSGITFSMADWSYLSGEFVMGCEFRRDRAIKPILQFGVSQPAVFLRGSGPRNWTPSFTISFGLGF